MYNDKKQLIINIEIEYSFDSDLVEIKDLLKQIIDLKNVKGIEYKEKN